MGVDAFWAKRLGLEVPSSRAQRIRDYLRLASRLRWQRQGSFLAATLLAVFYFDPMITLVCYAAVLGTEALDLWMCSKAKAVDVEDPHAAHRMMRTITLNTALSAIAISIFIVAMALQEGRGGHFTPIFFLFSASLFAVMYNSQMIGILVLRLSIYGGAFVFMAFLDVVRYLPDWHSTIWLNFFTIFFVLYFIANISLKFYQHYQEQLRQLQLIKEESARTRAAYEVKSQFISTVSHELRTPLTSIKGALELANSGVLGDIPDRVKKVLEIAAKNGQRLATLVNDLLDLQKMESGEMQFSCRRVGVNDLVQEAVESISGYADTLGIHVTTVLSSQEPVIKVDRSRMIQVMNNLLSNALKFSDQGDSVQALVEQNGPRVRISVKDEGIGIPENAREKVFGKFSQVDSSDIRKIGGTGLGLSITKQIVEHHGGTIDYVSSPGVGSTFYVELPVEEEIPSVTSVQKRRA